MSRLFCFGLGYSAGFLARDLAAAGWTIAGTSRDPAGGAALFTRDHPLADPARTLSGATHVLLSVPPDEFGDPVLDRLAAAVAAIAGLRWVGYLSTTGGYGDCGGAWVDETTEPRPAGERGRRRLRAEEGWLALHRSTHLPLHIFRLAGIYGPGRSPLDAVRAGTARRIDKPGHVFSRIHVADLAQTLVRAMTRRDPGRVYNVCDDEAAAPGEVISHAADLLGVASPPIVEFAAATLSPMARSFYDDNKRVCNRRIKTALGVTLRYPSYREGLAAILALEGGAVPR